MKDWGKFPDYVGSFSTRMHVTSFEYHNYLRHKRGLRRDNDDNTPVRGSLHLSRISKRAKECRTMISRTRKSSRLNRNWFFEFEPARRTEMPASSAIRRNYYNAWDREKERDRSIDRRLYASKVHRNTTIFLTSGNCACGHRIALTCLSTLPMPLKARVEQLFVGGGGGVVFIHYRW